jgi:hypothetical protein
MLTHSYKQGYTPSPTCGMAFQLSKYALATLGGVL